jgi:hypothetical protein
MFNASFISIFGDEITVLGLVDCPRFDVQYVVNAKIFTLTGVERDSLMPQSCLREYPRGKVLELSSIPVKNSPLIWSFDSSIVSWAAASAYKIEESWLINVDASGHFYVSHTDDDVADMCTPKGTFGSLVEAKEFCQKEETRIINRLLGDANKIWGK